MFNLKILTSGLASLILLAAFGLMLAGCNQTGQTPAPASSASTAAVVYTCPMHPQVRQSQPGKCPICGMDLIKAAADAPQPTTAAPPSAEPK